MNAAIVVASVWFSLTVIPGHPLRRLLLLVAALLPLWGAWSLRPQATSLLLLTVLLHLLTRERLWWIPPLFILWANMHGAVAYGGYVLVVAAVVAGGFWLRNRADDHARRRAVMLAAVTVALLWRYKKLQEPVIIAAAAAAGLILYPLTHA